MSERIIDWRQQTSINCRHAVIVSRLVENGDVQNTRMSAACNYPDTCDVKTKDIKAAGGADKRGAARCFASVELGVRNNCILNQGC